MKNIVFISCGQWAPAEKQLGRDIAEMIRAKTSLEPFFAELVQDLSALDANILEALRECVAFIVVMHPRGEISRPDGPKLVRASVWVEQEIAIAAYIRQMENHPIKVIPFAESSVDLEGMRQLLNLSPTRFKDEAEVLTELDKQLEGWESWIVPFRPILKARQRNGWCTIVADGSVFTAEYPSQQSTGHVTLGLASGGGSNITRARLFIRYDRSALILGCDQPNSPSPEHLESLARGIIIRIEVLRPDTIFGFGLEISSRHGDPLKEAQLHVHIEADECPEGLDLGQVIVKNSHPQEADPKQPI